MLAKSLPSPALAFCHGASSHSSSPCFVVPASLKSTVHGNPWNPLFSWNQTENPRNNVVLSKRWELHSTAPTLDITLSNEDTEKWASCREALSVFDFSIEEQDKMLGKAFGQVRSPYWGEERKAEVPNYEIVNEILEYLRSLSLSDEDLSKLLKKFPEVLGCSLENELKNNVQILENQWGITGKPLRNLLLRNPKVLGYNVDCKGDCVAQCTRCWARF
ncbi:Transcription termination factor MTERF4 chloroplastic [Bienertia sinuspersici]